MPAGRRLTQQEIIVDKCANAEEYFRKIYEAKKNGDAWAKDIPCDSIVYFTLTNQMDKVNNMINQQRAKIGSLESA